MKIRVKTSSLIILLGAILWCTPQGLNLLFSQYASIFNMIRCMMWGILFILSVVRKKRLGHFGVVLHGFWFVFLLCIISADFTVNNLNTWLIPFCSTCGFFLLTILYSVENVVICFFKYFYIISILNLVLLFIMPQGFAFQLTAYDGLSTFDSFSNFISTDNTYAPFLMCFLLFGEICKEKISKRVYAGMWIIALITAIKIWSATCLIGLGFYIFILSSKKFKSIFGKLKVWKIVLIFFSVFILVYYFRIQNLFSVFFIQILGKDLTFTGRIGLWEKSIEMIKEKWIFGWGNKNNGAIILRNYYYWYSHNILLDILLEGGVVTLAAFTGLLYTMAKKVKGYLNNKNIKICLSVILVFMILNMAESYFNSIYFYIPMITGVGFAIKYRQMTQE